MLLPQFEGVVEPRAEDGRRLARVLGCAKYDDGVGMGERVSAGGAAYAYIDGNRPEGEEKEREEEEAKKCPHAQRISATSPAGIAPAR